MTSTRGRKAPTPVEPQRPELRNGNAAPQPTAKAATAAAARTPSASPARRAPAPKASLPATPPQGPSPASAEPAAMPTPAELVAQLMEIWSGRSELAPEPKDRRFKDPAWASNPMYKAWLQSYLAWGSWLDAAVAAVGLEHREAGRASFMLEQIRDALAPTNFFWGNPAAVRRAYETGGASTIRGAANWLEDLAHNGGMPAQVDRRPFKVGETMAATPGAVVYRCEMFELLQYTPQTQQVYSRPLLVVPPQVNRFYAVDLAPGRSLFEHLLKGGVQVFSIVWRNPTSEQRDWGFEAYAASTLEAVDIVRAISGSPDVNVSGACAGGMTLTLVLAHLAARADHRINAAMLMVTLLDTSVESQLSMLANDTTLELALLASSQAGVLTGQQLAEVFSFLRPNDLIWNYWTNNYLLGENPAAFDILAWNSDTTNLTAQLHHDLIHLIKSNALVNKQAGMHVLGTPIDLSKVTCDTFVVAALTDHLTPWQGCYAATQLFSGKSEFVLCASGHIQSIVSPPGNPKSRYFENPRTPADPAAWLAGATEQHGSWWDRYVTWLGERGGAQRPAPETLGNQQYPVLGAAPGAYVFE